MNFSIKYFSIFVSFFISSFVLASTTFAQNNVFSNLEKSVAGFQSVVGRISAILIILIFVMFVWNLVKFIHTGGDSETAKKNMGWSLLAVVVVTSIWGIIAFIRNIIGIDADVDANNLVIPSVVGNDQNGGTSSSGAGSSSGQFFGGRSRGPGGRPINTGGSGSGATRPGDYGDGTRGGGSGGSSRGGATRPGDYGDGTRGGRDGGATRGGSYGDGTRGGIYIDYTY